VSLYYIAGLFAVKPGLEKTDFFYSVEFFALVIDYAAQLYKISAAIYCFVIMIPRHYQKQLV